MSLLAVIDYETEGIEPRPHYPPKPVGVAIKHNRKCFYMAWGHPTGNTHTKQEARRYIKGLIGDGYELIMHNGKFDLDVQETHLGIKMPPWHLWHCTMFLAFLWDPHNKNLSLKPLADDLLDMPAEEQDEVKEWILRNVPEAKKRPSTWGAYICRAPAKLVGKYAVGDVVRTWKLFQLFWGEVKNDQRLKGAYDRERQLASVLLRMERHGIPAGRARLERDVPIFRRRLSDLENKIKRRIGINKSEEIKFSGKNFAQSLEDAGKIDDWVLTAKGNPSTSADNLKIACNDKTLVKWLEARSQLATCLNTFALPWLEQVRDHDRIYATFNQVRQANERGRGLVGARTGRLSMTPNLQNVIRSDKESDLVPRMRRYICPEKGRYFVRRDYTQQELRILAHYICGNFLQMYIDNPRTDAHDAAQELIHKLTGVWLERRDVKDIAFAILYGVGLPKLANNIGCTIEDAKMFKGAYLRAMNGLQELMDDLKQRAKDEEPIYTWGGRQYYCEEKQWRNGRWWTYEYKMINYLVQGSAADCTKQAMINYDSLSISQDCPMILQVHDELLLTAPKKLVRAAHNKLAQCLAAVDFAVPMLSDGKTGYYSWDEMRVHRD